MVHISSTLLKFRNIFKVPDKNVFQWFPGHMGKGLKQMRQKLKNVDCLIEVHDARIPLTGRNNILKTALGLKPYILVLNKKDLSDLSQQLLVNEYLQQNGEMEIIYTNSKDQKCSGIEQIIPTVTTLVGKTQRFHRAEEVGFSVMVIGVPNVGKSSLINNLRNTILKRTSAAPVGAIAGVTRSVTTHIKVSHDPLIYLLDTPGILTPHVPDATTGMKLALCSTMQDHLIGISLIADYLLFWLNKNNHYSYVDFLGLKEPCDDVHELLVLTALKLNKVKKIRTTNNDYSILPDTEIAASHFIKAFRTGLLGKYTLDHDIILK